MEFKDAIEILGEKGITFKVNHKSMCIEFYTLIDGRSIKLGVHDKQYNYITDFEINDYDDMIPVIEEVSEYNFLVPLHVVTMDRRMLSDCERCERYEKELEELEMDVRRLEEDICYNDDYTSRYHDLKACF